MLLASNFENIVSERLVAEAPWMMYRGGYYYLFYSSGWTFETKYHIRVARGREITGPFVRSNVPVITTDWDTLNQVVGILWKSDINLYVGSELLLSWSRSWCNS